MQAQPKINIIELALKNKPEEKSLLEQLESAKQDIKKAEFLAHFHQGKDHLKPFFRINQKEYFELLDWSGREIKQNKKGAIPNHLEPIFKRLQINQDLWIDSLKNYENIFYRVVGKITKAFELLKDTASKWFKGSKINRALFGT
jgi:hypothetical protein